MKVDLRQQLKASHTPEKIRQRLAQGQSHSYLRDFVYGAVDGAVTTFAVVSGVVGADLATHIIIIMGMANLVADGFSMAVSNFLGIRSEKQLLEKARLEEKRHIEAYPEGEKEEIRQIYTNKGFSGDILEEAVQIITANKKQWANTMLQEEYDLPLNQVMAWRAALATFTAFLLVGFIPIAPFLWNYLSQYPFTNPFLWSSIGTGGAFFAIGAIKSRFVDKLWYLSGLETLVLGGAAASLAYLIGDLLKGLA
ncbi:VIT1/CCC1 transporter family protein [Pontibacter pamirensis]|uniref:VIT1/CCC1 transporter family protein n=1 Tax=Pontibacter pamirensis TaxID=2562824 RepID=UPI001389CBD7|nr:VIT1/CCC1 transporter family protein [Pontibacter pamirensis]